MQNVISQSESKAISLLRVIAMGTIVVCHLLQGYDNPYCYLFNIGVQVFLAISGYLYGCKTIQSWKPWFVTRLKKLYVPYLLFFLVCIPFYYWRAVEEISLSKIVLYIFDLQGLVPHWGIKGLGHLWFMSAIAICYLITPLLQYSRKFAFTLPLLLIVAILEFFLIRFAEWQFSWLFVYALAYQYANVNNRGRNTIVVFMGALFLWSLMAISWNDILHNGLWNQWLHISSGVLAVILVITLAKCQNFSFANQALKVADRYSYEIYITHHIFILGPFSILFLFKYTVINVVLILLLTMLTAFVLHKMAAEISKIW